MNTHHRTGIVVAIAAFAALATVVAAGRPLDPPETAASITTEDCRAAVGDIKVMGNDVRNFDMSLQQKLEALRAAPDIQRLGAIEALLEEMVEQRPAIRTHMKRTHQQMMRHLLLHMTTEDAEQRRAAMAECPIIQYLRHEEPSRGVGEIAQELTY